ncbi:hypothetical protein [Thermococcus sp.]|uniref:hypothetical protein n=1 Tax=Thermococcus sp. TaxID=35749 RepID=UPI002635C988|nr:hypothetical protein [Thermococcus sp.]
MDQKITSLVPKSGIIIDNTLASEEEEKALITVEAYKISFESSLRKRKLAFLAGAITSGIGVLSLVQTGNAAMAFGLIGAGLGIIALGQIAIKPHPLRVLSKVHVPLLLVPYDGGSVVIGPDYFESKGVPGTVVKELVFRDVNVEEAAKIASELPSVYDSFDSEVALREKLHEITNSLTPKSEISTRVVASDSGFIKPLVEVLMKISRGGQPIKALQFEGIEKKVETVKQLEQLEKRAESELEILSSVREKVEDSFVVFNNSLMALLVRIDSYFSEVRKLLKKALFGGVNIHATPTKEELKEYGYAYVQHRYHVRLNSTYSPNSLVAVFQRYIDRAENKIRGRVSEYVASMEREIMNVKDETRRLVDLTKEKYREKIGRKKERVRDLKEKAKDREKELRSIERQISNLTSQAERYEDEASRYESKADWAETASERRSYLSRANKARKEADKLV